MPVQAPPECDPRVTALVDKLVREDSLTEGERRSIHRTPLVRPVTFLLEGGVKQHGFSKNISPAGISVLINQPLPDGYVAKLCVHGNNIDELWICSELRWRHTFDDNGWFLTGWKFIAPARSV